jgi:DNA modification methylase
MTQGGIATVQVEMMPVETLRPHPKNPRLHPDKAIEKLTRSLKEYGWTNPILLSADGLVLAGHARLKAAKAAGITEVPVIRLPLSGAKAEAYLIADNRLQDETDWDLPALKDLLGELDTGEFDLRLTGFDMHEIEMMMTAVGGGIVEDEVPEPPETPVSKPGDVWLCGKHRVMCGDSTKAEDVARLMAGQKADMAFTDPPWNVAIGKDSNPPHRQREGLANDDLPAEGFRCFLNGFAGLLAGVCTGDVYCVLGSGQWPMLDAALQGAGLHWSATIIWVKDMFVLGRSKYHRRYEPLWYGWHQKGKSSFVGDRKQDDVWEIPRPKRSDEHPTMKPVALVARALRNSSERDQVVADPFLGSGTTVIAAEQLDRVCYGMEIEPRYVDVTVKRWEQFTGKKARLEDAHERA